MTPDIDVVARDLPYATRLAVRPAETIDMVVIHCTELPSLDLAREYGERIHYPESGTGNSGHFYIERSGRVEQWVPPLRVAHHVRGFNECSIGIELDNPGRYPDWLDSRNQQMTAPYPDSQIRSLTKLLLMIRHKFPAVTWIAGHEQLDRVRVSASDDRRLEVFRKRDPGPMFPWGRILPQSGLKQFENPGITE